MRQTIYIFMLSIASILAAGCTGRSSTRDADGTDKYLNAGFDQIRNTADSLYSNMQFRDAYELYLKLLDAKEAQSDSEKRLYVLNALAMASELSGHKAEENDWLQQLLELSMKVGNDYYHSLAHIAMGQNLFYEGDHEKGIHNLKEAVELLAKTDRRDTDHLMHGHLIMLARLYSETKDYDSALRTDERNLLLTMQGTRWGDAPNQQLIDRRMALAKLAALLARMKNYQRADSAYAAWKAVEYEGNHTRDYFIVDYMKQRGRYQEAIPIYNDLIERVRRQGDTLGEMMNTAKWGLAEVYRKMGQCSQAAILYEQVLEIQDTLKSRKARKTAQELAAAYHAKEQEQIIMQQQAENTRQRYLLFSVLAVMLGLVVLAVVIIHKNRIISRKNRFLAKQITETLKYKTHPQPLPVREGSNYSQGDVSAEVQSTPLPHREGQGGGSTDDQLFQQIHDVIEREHLYLDPNFGRDAIIERFQLSKDRVGAAFSKGSAYESVTDYIQQLRLDHAARLLAEQPGRSITQIAADSGFSSSSYFSNCFFKYFGIRPTDFRRDTVPSSND